MIDLRGGSFSAFNYDGGRALEVFHRDPIWADPMPDMEITKLGIRLVLCEDERIVTPRATRGFPWEPHTPPDFVDNFPSGDRLRGRPRLR